ncbi:hypothetical protein PIB30_035964 [Stylosanthes scabra]|uniref:PHD-type domain-containing protein n=1 Tax=Stylosanthes scabra TaxID=79078 RepID=A0ABU6RDR1_9FABA|nr:hypothetical protein [Stylosanthes scabra]
MIQNADMKLESGTCNVCSSPCSSCMHLNRALTRSKAKEFSDENCRLGEANQSSTVEGDQSSHRSRTCERLNHASSETGNMLSVNSSHESLSENAESTRPLSEKHQDAKCLEGLDDNTSCISRTSNDDFVINDNTGVLSTRVYPKSESDSDSDVGNVKDKDHKVPVRDGLREKQGELVKSAVKPEAHSEDESDDSDVVEHDVKVCDICGDAGREELLAVCSRCSDGAEHTYCMREMLEKVPEGDWLCEECKYAQEAENKRLAADKIVHKVSSTAHISGKRPLESEELAKAAKRQAHESSIGSPKGSSPKRIFPLSRESSFKNHDKGKLKSGDHSSICNHPDGNNRELARSLSAGPRSQTAKSTSLKSNSFNINSKPRVKLVDEVPQKNKGGSEQGSKNIETPGQMMSKSTSLKSSNLSRSSATESKDKMLTSKSGTTPDLKGSRLTKESERKFLSRVDRPIGCSTISTPKGDQKLSARGETAKPSAVSNRECQVNQDGRLNSLSKNNISRKSLTPLVSAESTTSGDETQSDGPPQSRELANHVDNTKDSSSDHVSPGESPLFHKSKDFSHATECVVANTQEFGLEGSTTAPYGSKDEIHKDNRLKAAIQAALLRRPEICKKKEVPVRTDEFSTSGTDLNSKVSFQDQAFVINTPKNILSTEETKARLEILYSPTFETSSSNGSRPVSFSPTDSHSQPRKLESVCPDPGKPVVRDLHNQTLAVSSFVSQISAFPEHQYIWQGEFRVHKNGKLPDLYTGIQAHLSTGASPKVLEVVNKFLPEVSLNEVSRMSTWPSQFHQRGAREDNIALYFFAKDIESYERHYKGLLDHMIRNDLALKGIFDGVELLIFPSNQLPENSRRWNMLFFLWGVFRGQRMNHSDSAGKVCIPSLNAVPVEKDFPTPVTTLSETHSSLKPMDGQSIACGRTCNAVLPPTSIDEGHTIFHGNFDIKETSCDQTCLGSQVNLHSLDSKINTESTSKIPSSSGQLCQEMHSTGSSLKDGQYRVSIPPEPMGTVLSSRIVETNSDCDISVKQEKQEIDTASNTSKNQISERINHDEDQQRPKRKLIEEDLNISVEATIQEDPTRRSINCQETNDKKVHHIDVPDAALKASADSYQKLPWDKVNGKLEGGESSNKKLKSGLSDIYGNCSSGGRESFNGSFTALENHPGTFSSVESRGCKEASFDKIIYEDLGTMERTFFPVGSHQKNDTHMMLNGIPLEGPCEYEGQFQVGIPNLELGLGGKTKPQPPLAPPLPLHKGMFPFLVGPVDKKNNQEKPPEEVAHEQEGDDSVAASLSLSLSFPSSNKEPPKPGPKAEHSPDDDRVNTPFLLFGRYTDK